MREPIGLYLHVPFCGRKCDYCDFYSVPPSAQALDAYCGAVRESLVRYAAPELTADTLYFGGGTPSLLGAERLAALVQAARASFGLADAEITVEVNPGTVRAGFFTALARAGVNRVSLGLQSAHAEELRLLTRRHSVQDALAAAEAARAAGIGNLSLDVMLGIPGQTRDSLRETLEFCARAGAEHISAYLLKIEESTPFSARRDALALPDEDAQAELYLEACEQLAALGYRQYEISNFARPGRESRHNLKYWDAREYLGIGPSAHSFLAGRRFYYPRSLSDFLRGAPPVEDGSGGGLEEYAMLRLRLADGLRYASARARYADCAPALAEIARRAEPLAKAGLLVSDGEGVRLNARGFLVSNAIIGRLLA